MGDRRAPRVTNFTDVGVVGRKTGISVSSSLQRDPHGMEELDAFFSPEKSPAATTVGAPTPAPASTNGNGTLTASESMSMQHSESALTVPLALEQQQQRQRSPLHVRSPPRMSVSGSPRRGSSVGPPSSPPRRALDTPPIRASPARRLDFGANKTAARDNLPPPKANGGTREDPVKPNGNGRAVEEEEATPQDEENTPPKTKAPPPQKKKTGLMQHKKKPKPKQLANIFDNESSEEGPDPDKENSSISITEEVSQMLNDTISPLRQQDGVGGEDTSMPDAGDIDEEDAEPEPTPKPALAKRGPKVKTGPAKKAVKEPAPEKPAVKGRAKKDMPPQPTPESSVSRRSSRGKPITESPAATPPEPGTKPKRATAASVANSKKKVTAREKKAKQPVVEEADIEQAEIEQDEDVEPAPEPESEQEGSEAEEDESARPPKRARKTAAGKEKVPAEPAKKAAKSAAADTSSSRTKPTRVEKGKGKGNPVSKPRTKPSAKEAPLSTSASESESSASKPVKLSGQRIIREKPPPPLERDASTGAERRSTRHRVAPLQYWKNEKIVYALGSRRQSAGANAIALPQIQEIIRVESDSPATKRKPRSRAHPAAKKRKRSVGPGSKESRESDVESAEEDEGDLEAWEEAKDSEGFVGVKRGLVKCYPPLRDETGEVLEETELAFSKQRIVTVDVMDGRFTFVKTCSTDFFGTGVIDMPPGGQKRTKNAGKMMLVFYVVKGRATVSVGPKEAETTFRVGRGGQFMVPRGNLYSIDNEFDAPLKMFFAQGCEVVKSADEL